MHAFIPIVALLGLAAAQSDTTATGTSSSAAPNPTTECIAKCAAGDVNCQAICVNVPAPNESMIEATNECSRNECTQGDSGPEDTKKYGECLASCASDYYYVSGGTPTGVFTANTASTASAPANTNASATTGSGSSASTTGSSSSETGSSDSSESSASSTRSQAASSAASSASESAAAESTGAATALTLSKEVLGVSGGVLGLLVAALAL